MTTEPPVTYCPPGCAQGYNPEGLTMQLPDDMLRRAGDKHVHDKMVHPFHGAFKLNREIFRKRFNRAYTE